METAVREISELRTADGEQIVKNLEYVYHMSGRRIQSIEFIFTPFSADLTGNSSLAFTKRTSSPGKTSPFVEEAKRVLEYLNYLWSVNIEENVNSMLTHVPNQGGVRFDTNDGKVLQPIHKLLEHGVPIEELFQVAEMKAIEWKFMSPEMEINLKPSVIFGPKYSEYRVFVELFKKNHLLWFICDLGQQNFEIPLDGPWNDN